MIKVVFFASIRESLGESSLLIECEPSINSVADLIGKIGELQGEVWHSVLSAPSVLVAVNQEMSELSKPVNDGDEVAFFPPVTGG